MVLAGLRFTELDAILKENGYEVVSGDFWETHNRIILKRGNEPAIVLQFKEFYNFSFVVTFLNSLNIEPPRHCNKPYHQYMKYLKSKLKQMDLNYLFEHCNIKDISFKQIEISFKDIGINTKNDCDILLSSMDTEYYHEEAINSILDYRNSME